MKDGDILILKLRLKNSLKNCVEFKPTYIYWDEKFKEIKQ